MAGGEGWASGEPGTADHLPADGLQRGGGVGAPQRLPSAPSHQEACSQGGEGPHSGPPSSKGKAPISHHTSWVASIHIISFLPSSGITVSKLSAVLVE